MKLSVKASLLLTGLVLAVISATSLFLFDYQRRAVKGYILQDMESEAAFLAASFKSHVEENLRDMTAVAGNLTPLTLASGGKDELRRSLALQARFFTAFDGGLFILDRQGRLVADFPPHPEKEDKAFHGDDAFLRTMDGGKGVLSGPRISPRTGLPAIVYTAPIRSLDGRIEYVAGGEVNIASPKAFGYMVRRKLGKSGYIYVADASGIIVAHPDAGRIFTKVEPGANPFLDMTLAGAGSAGESRNSRGIPMLAASRSMPELGWTVIAQVPAREASETLIDGLRAVGIFFLATLAVVIPVGFAAMRRIARPLEALEKAAHIIANDLRRSEGALSRPFASSALDALRKMRSNDEIGRLARAFFQLSVRLKQSLASLRAAVSDWERTFSSVQEAVFVLDSEGGVLRCNRAAEDMLRLIKAEILGRHWQETLANGHEPPAEWPSGETLRKSGRFKAATAIPGREGMFELTFSSIMGRREGKGFLLTVTDVTERLRGEERIRNLAFHDPLTRLPNRVLLGDRLEQAIATAQRNQSSVSVLFLDLDDFKQVNDRHGHDAGDELLRQAARRLSSCLRANDTLARYSGDEFVCVLMDIRNLQEAEAIASRMLAALAEPFELSGALARVGASIGIAFYPKDGVTPAQLLSHADTAMYRAKGRGKNGFWVAEGLDSGGVEDMPRQ